MNAIIKVLLTTQDKVKWAKKKAQLLLMTTNFVLPPIDETKSFVREQFPQLK